MTDDHTAIKPNEELEEKEAKKIMAIYGQSTKDATIICIHEANLKLIKQLDRQEKAFFRLKELDSCQRARINKLGQKLKRNIDKG